LQKKKVPLYEDIRDSNRSDSEKQNFETVEDISNQPDLIIEDKLRDEILHREIEKLPVQQRAIITLFHLDQMSYNEIGEIMNLPKGTVKSYLFRARKMLKEKLLEKYKIEEIYR
jgi:RNA polymerase sigma-70 factor (ECF subfamily)